MCVFVRVVCVNQPLRFRQEHGKNGGGAKALHVLAGHKGFWGIVNNDRGPLTNRNIHGIPPRVQPLFRIGAHPLGIIAQRAVIQHYFRAVQVFCEYAELPDPEAPIQAAV